MTRNKIFMKIMFICMVMMLCLGCCITEVKAVSAADIIADYKADPDAVEETISSLSKEEAEDWQKELRSYNNAMNKPSGVTDAGIPIFPNYPAEDESAVNKLLNSLDSRLAQISGEENKDNLDEEEMMDWSAEEIRDWLLENNADSAGLSSDLRNEWKETIDNSDYDDQTKEDLKARVDGATTSDLNDDRVDDIYDTAESPIYNYPTKIGSNDNAEESLEDLITDGNRFLSNGTLNLNENALQNFSGTMFNILLAVGVVIAVIAGAVIGIKLMTSSVEEQADAKKLLVPYVVGCIVVFGAFGIWKLVVTILQGI